MKNLLKKISDWIIADATPPTPPVFKKKEPMPEEKKKEEKLPEEYDNVTLFIDGRPKKVSRSSKYLLDMLTLD